MGFPSPATDFAEDRLSLDTICNTRAPSVYYFKAGNGSRLAGINRGALLIVNTAIKPGDGSIIAAELNGEFKLVRYRNVPVVHFEELDQPDRRIPLLERELEVEEESICFGVVTHVLNDVRAF